MKGKIDSPIVKWSVIGISLAWLLISGWLAFKPEPASSYNVGYYQATSTSASGCRGKYSKRSFSERYKCTMDSRLALDREAAIRWSLRLVVICGPPILLGVFYNRARKKQKRLADAKAARRRHRQATEAARQTPKRGTDIDAGSASPA